MLHVYFDGGERDVNGVERKERDGSEVKVEVEVTL
jgi:hypothetical protein